MNNNEANSAGTFAIGVAAGLAIGAGLALLFAPKAGKELRQDLGESMDSVRRAVARRYRDLADRAGAEVENLEETAAKAAESVESGARQFIDDLDSRSSGSRRFS
jgi:gas vesicle protein